MQGCLKAVAEFLFIFNSEITCLTKGTFKGTVVTDSQSNICHYPISTHKCVFIIHLTYLCVWLSEIRCFISQSVLRLVCVLLL